MRGELEIQAPPHFVARSLQVLRGPWLKTWPKLAVGGGAAGAWAAVACSL